MPAEASFLLTKIIATVGPATDSPETLAKLIEEGVRVFRINFSHGSFDDFKRMLGHVREASDRIGIEVAALGDLSGPKIRVEQVVEGGINLHRGDEIRFVRDNVTAGAEGVPPRTFSTTYDAMLDDVKPGERLLIDDGNVRALVIDSDTDDALVATVTTGGKVTSKKGVNLPDSNLTVKAITDYDWQCVDWALENGIDLLALSFVRKAEELAELKRYLDEHRRSGYRLPVVAKIEKPQAIDDLDGITAEADILMVARGDLGVEMDLADVPVIQKRILAKAHDHGKPVIVATQMLQSMIDAPVPTRAEASDVANAIFDGADAVMLSGETAVGKYAFESVNVMARIARAVQQDVGRDTAHWGEPPSLPQAHRYRTAALAHGVATVVRDLHAKAIVVWSQRGGGARYLSQNRPTIPIIAASDDRSALRRMGPLFAVVPVYLDQPESVSDFVAKMDRMLIDKGWAKPGDPIVFVAGEPIGVPGVTNKLRIQYAGDSLDQTTG